jgi:hypothetical protein
MSKGWTVIGSPALTMLVWMPSTPRLQNRCARNCGAPIDDRTHDALACTFAPFA